MAAQEGKFLARLFSRNAIAPLPGRMPAAAAAAPGGETHVNTGAWVPLPEGAAPFQ